MAVFFSKMLVLVAACVTADIVGSHNEDRPYHQEVSGGPIRPEVSGAEHDLFDSVDSVSLIKRSLQRFDAPDSSLRAERRLRNRKFWDTLSRNGNLSPSEETLLRREELMDQVIRLLEGEGTEMLGEEAERGGMRAEIDVVATGGSLVTMDAEIALLLRNATESLRQSSHLVFQQTRRAELAAEENRQDEALESGEELSGNVAAHASYANDDLSQVSGMNIAAFGRRKLLDPAAMRQDRLRRMDLLAGVMQPEAENLGDVLTGLRVVRENARQVTHSNMFRRGENGQNIYLGKRRGTATRSEDFSGSSGASTTFSGCGAAAGGDAREVSGRSSENHQVVCEWLEPIGSSQEKGRASYRVTPQSVLDVAKKLGEEADSVRKDYMGMILGFASAIIAEFKDK